MRSLAVSDQDEFIMITDSGQVVRTRVADTRVIGRNTQGVTLMNVPDGDRVSSVALIEPDDEDGRRGRRRRG